MFGLMILGRMCGQGGLHYIMMQLCIQQHVNLSQRMLMLLNLLNDVEKNPGPVLYDKIYIVYWITIYIYFNIKVIFFLHFVWINGRARNVDFWVWTCFCFLWRRGITWRKQRRHFKLRKHGINDSSDHCSFGQFSLWKKSVLEKIEIDTIEEKELFMLRKAQHVCVLRKACLWREFVTVRTFGRKWEEHLKLTEKSDWNVKNIGIFKWIW